MSNGVFYADAVNGNDANDGLSEATAKQTISAGLGLFSGGNNVLYLQATGDYVLSSTITLNQTGSLAVGANRIEGYTTTPGARDGRPTITGSTPGAINFFQFGSGTMYIDCVHLRFYAAGIAFLPGYGATGGPNWIDCVSDACSWFMYGDYGGYWYIYGSLWGCEIKNGWDGLLNESPLHLYDCWIHDNGNDGINYYSGGQAGGTWYLERCLLIIVLSRIMAPMESEQKRFTVLARI
jgi:hypothetical protein